MEGDHYYNPTAMTAVSWLFIAISVLVFAVFAYAGVTSWTMWGCAISLYIIATIAAYMWGWLNKASPLIHQSYSATERVAVKMMFAWVAAVVLLGIATLNVAT